MCRRREANPVPQRMLPYTFVRHGGFQRRGCESQAHYFPSSHEQSLVLSKDSHSRCHGQALASSLRVQKLSRGSRGLEARDRVNTKQARNRVNNKQARNRVNNEQARIRVNNELEENRATRTPSAVDALQKKPGGAEMRAVTKGWRAQVVTSHARGARVIRPEAPPLHKWVGSPLQRQRIRHGGQARHHSNDVRRK